MTRREQMQHEWKAAFGDCGMEFQTKQFLHANRQYGAFLGLVIKRMGVACRRNEMGWRFLVETARHRPFEQ